MKELAINDQIRDKQVRLLDADGTQLGIVDGAEAQRIADSKMLDLVKISPTAVPPVCKLMDYGKYRFEQIKKEKEARKNQKIVELKEIRLSMTIDDNDIVTKVKNAKKFLLEGDKVKVSLRMRGRQMAYANNGVEVMNNFFQQLSELAIMERKPLTEGRSIIMILAPTAINKKQQQKEKENA